MQSNTQAKTHKLVVTAMPAAVASVLMFLEFSVPLNYFITYPIYTVFIPMEGIIGMYQLILPFVDDLLECLLIFNMPFPFCKGMLDVLIAFLIYKPLSPLLHR